ncbi:MAG: lytic transglycosylase domain-containing protein [Clostridia bacterium]|nr:lytic transglycosylase domain-containing protein [Clostridia bacterium]
MKTKKKNKIGYFLAFFICVAVIIGGALIFYQMKYPVRYQEFVVKYANEYSLDKTLVCSLINEESSFNPNAVSSKGAMGLMQITSATGEFIAKKLDDEFVEENLFDPETNIRYGCFYLDYLRTKFVDEEVYLSAYNAGETTVRLWLSNSNLSNDGVTLSTIPYKITREYTTSILQGKKHYIGRI